MRRKWGSVKALVVALAGCEITVQTESFYQTLMRVAKRNHQPIRVRCEAFSFHRKPNRQRP